MMAIIGMFFQACASIQAMQDKVQHVQYEGRWNRTLKSSGSGFWPKEMLQMAFRNRKLLAVQTDMYMQGHAGRISFLSSLAVKVP